jgi:hypothetical protein
VEDVSEFKEEGVVGEIAAKDGKIFVLSLHQVANVLHNCPLLLLLRLLR